MYCRNCGGPIPDQAVFCSHCGQPVSPRADTKPWWVREAGSWFHLYAGQTWPIVMVMFIFLGGLVLLIGSELWKVLGIVWMAYGIRELVRCHKAHQAGVDYVPVGAKLAYIGVVIAGIVAAAYLVYILFFPASPIEQVKQMEFDETPGYTVEQIVEGSLNNVTWSSKQGGGETYVYAYGTEGGDRIGFEFTVQDYGDDVFVSLTDLYAGGIWFGGDVATLAFMELYGGM